MPNSTIRTQPAERRQVAALPWRRGAGGLAILLVTSRETRRRVTPKGGRRVGLTDAAAAAPEAPEGAGVGGWWTKPTPCTACRGRSSRP